MEASCAAAIKQEQLAPAERYEAFFAVLARDAESSIAAIELVLAQPAISSQLIDNLNASMHLRALLADLFLVTEILELRQAQAWHDAGAGIELIGEFQEPRKFQGPREVCRMYSPQVLDHFEHPRNAGDG